MYSALYYWGDGHLGGQDSSGYWQSATANNTSDAYYLSVGGSSDLNPRNTNDKVFGFTLRRRRE